MSKPSVDPQDVVLLRQLTEKYDMDLHQLADVIDSSNEAASSVQATRTPEPDFFKKIFEQVQDGIMVLNGDGHYVAVNPMACTLFGYSEDEFLALHYRVTITQATLDWMDDTANNWRSERVVFGELEMVRKDGTPFIAQVAVTRNFIPDYVVATVRDITERKNEQLSVQRDQQLLRTMYDGTQTSIFIVDVDESGDFFYGGLNRAHQERTGLTNEVIVGKRPEEIPGVMPEGAAHMRNQYRACYEAGETIHYEEMLNFYGTDTLWLTILTPLRNEVGRIYRLIGMSLDITEERATQEALHDAAIRTLQLEHDKRTSAQRAEMIAMLGHEFKTPLSIIKTSAYILKSKLQSTAKSNVRKHLQQLDIQADRLNHLMQRIVDMFNPGFEVGQVELTPVNLEACIDDVVGSMNAVTIDDIPIFVEVESSYKAYMLDDELWRQILTNLLSNAIKYSPERHPVTLRCVATRDTIILTVADRGIGIAPDDLEQIFEPFQRGQNVGQIQGSGVGLATVRLAAQQLGGDVEVTSVLGEGTTFTVTLPAIPL